MERGLRCVFAPCWSQDHPALRSSVRRTLLHYYDIQRQVKRCPTHCGARRFTAWPCHWAAWGVAAGHHVIQHHSTVTQKKKAQPWPLHFSDSSAACAKPMCGLKYHADQCGTGGGKKCGCPSWALSLQSPHHPHWLSL